MARTVVELRKGKVEFYLGKKRISFVVYNNLPNTPGLSLEDAVINWAARTDEYTDASLCAYIMDKETGYVCMTEEIFDELFIHH